MVLPEASKPKMVDVEPVDNPKYCIVSAEETTISKPFNKYLINNFIMK
jgi:hypothetical protein